MSPLEDVSGSTPVSGLKMPLSPVCAEVRIIMDAVRDNRATTADRLFVSAHSEHCAGCASEWAFLQATKTAWARTPVAIPSASLSARIAAATYRKPTFAERFVSAFAFLNPAPVRVAIGVAAVAGISFLALPRMTMVPDEKSPTITESAPIVVQNTPAQEKETDSAPVAAAPVLKTVPTIKKETPKPTAPIAKPAPVVAAKSSAVEKALPKSVAVAETPAPKMSTSVKTHPTQVARNTSKAVREVPTAPVESVVSDTTPSVGEPENHTVATVIPPATIAKPEPKQPAANVPTTVVGMTAPDPEPSFTNGSNRINLKNTNSPLSGNMSGRPTYTSYAGENGSSIVSMPTKM